MDPGLQAAHLLLSCTLVSLHFGLCCCSLLSLLTADNQLHAGRPVRPVQLHTEDSPCARMERFCSVPAVAGASMESEGEHVPPHHSREIHRERERECSGACSYMYNQEAGAASKRDTRSTSITRSL